jgi:hypothetical protein
VCRTSNQPPRLSSLQQTHRLPHCPPRLTLCSEGLVRLGALLLSLFWVIDEPQPKDLTPSWPLAWR